MFSPVEMGGDVGRHRPLPADFVVFRGDSADDLGGELCYD
jgi:hypothetical protein